MATQHEHEDENEKKPETIIYTTQWGGNKDDYNPSLTVMLDQAQ